MTQEHADAEEARESVFEFHTELRRRTAADPEPGPPLRMYLEREGRSLPRRLAWTAVDGAHSAIAFAAGAEEFTGVHRSADGSLAELHGRLASRRAYPSLPSGVVPGDVLAFDTHEQVDPEPEPNAEAGAETDAEANAETDAKPDAEPVWRRAGRVLLLLDDGRGCPLRDLQWEDARGVTVAVSFAADRSSFLGYLDRPGREPVRYRGFALPGRPVPNGDELLKELEDFGRQALGVVNDVVGRLTGWLGGRNNGSGGNGGDGGGPRPA